MSVLFGPYQTFLLHGETAPSGPGPPHSRGFTITLRHTTIDRTPLDEWSVRSRDLYLTIDNTHTGQISVPLAGFKRKRVVADPLLRLRGHWDLLSNIQRFDFAINYPNIPESLIHHGCRSLCKQKQKFRTTEHEAFRYTSRVQKKTEILL
jgi:hypothetical protein